MTEKTEQKASQVSIHVEKSTDERLLRTELTEQDLLSKSKTLADGVSTLAELEDAFASVKKDYSSKIQALEASITSASTVIRQGYEIRKVKCEVLKDFDMGLIFVSRPDTGEIIEQEDMTTEQRNLGLSNFE